MKILFATLLYGYIASISSLNSTADSRKFFVPSSNDDVVAKLDFTTMSVPSAASPLVTINLLSKFNLNPGLKVMVDGYSDFVSTSFVKETDNHFIVWMNQTIHVFDPQLTRKIHSFNCGVDAPFPRQKRVLMSVVSTGNKLYFFDLVLYEIDLVSKTTTTVGYRHFDGVKDVHYDYAPILPVLKFSSDKKFIYLGYLLYYTSGKEEVQESRIRKYDLRSRAEVKSYIFSSDRRLSEFNFYGNEIVATIITSAMDTYEIWTMNSNLDVTSVRSLASKTGFNLGSAIYGNFASNWYDGSGYRQYKINKQGNEINLQSFVDAKIKLRSPYQGKLHYYHDMFVSGNGNIMSLYQPEISDYEIGNIYLFIHGNVGKLKSDLKVLYGNVLTTFNDKDSINLSLTNNGKFLWTLDGNILKKWSV